MNNKLKHSLPLVSIIVPTYNRCEFVQQAIDSVLAQTFQDFELIVVDDGSTDGTGDVLKTRYGGKIIYIWQENQGGPVARNTGISSAKGKYIALLDSDDFWLPEKLSRQVPVLENNPEVAVVLCQAWYVDNKGQRLGEQPLGVNTRSSDFSVEKLLLYNKIPAGSTTALIRRSVLDRVGGFSKDIRFGAEWDLWLRMAADSTMFMIPEPLAFYRRHKQTLSYFPEIEYVDRALSDRLVMLQRCINRYPGKVSKHDYDRAVANQYVRASLASFLLNKKEKGKERLRKAVELSPNFWKDNVDFAEQVTVFGDSYSIDKDGNFSPGLCLAFVDLLCANLPESLNRKDWIRLARGKARVEMGFRQYKSGDTKAAVQQILNGIRLAPKLVDLGVLAIFAEFLLGRGIVNKLRAFRHKDARSPV